MPIVKVWQQFKMAFDHWKIAILLPPKNVYGSPLNFISRIIRRPSN